MHPLPPPPGRSSRAPQDSQQSQPEHSTIPQAFGHVGGSSQDQGEGSSQAKPKRRKHRGGKKKRTRRQSFAAPSEDNSTLASISGDVSAENTAGRNRPSMPSNTFYQLGRTGGNMSNTSLDSEALLDHRYENTDCHVMDHDLVSNNYGRGQPSLRPRRDSRIGQSIFSAYRSSPPKHRWDVGASSSNTHHHHHHNRGTPGNAFGYNQDSDDDQEVHDRAPLLGSRDKRDARNTYGTPDRPTISPSPLRRESHSSASSRKRHRALSREASYGPGQALDYDVNNPPSMPNSPKLGAEMGFDDVMVGGFAAPRSPDIRRDESNDAFINIDGPERQNTVPLSTPPSPRLDPGEASARRRRTVALPAEEDVCFPIEGMSEIAEEDFPRAEPSEAGRGPRRRRRRWPDLSILEEWSAQEKEERSEGLRQMRISEPTLVNGRLRASKVAWQRMEEERPYRFTYFNEEFESTIHAQTISELVQPGGSFRELFIPDPPELDESSSGESEDEDHSPRNLSGNGTGNGDKLHSPQPSMTRHSSIVGGQKSSSQENSGAATPRKWDQPKPKRYGPRPTFWLDVLSPTEDEMRIISKAFGIHALTAEDILLQEAREKVELFRNYYFITYRSFEQDVTSEEFLEPVNIYVIVFREGVLSFHFSQTPHPANVRRRIRQLKDYLILSSDWISYAIIDDITDVFQPLIQNIEDEVDDIDDLILAVFEDPTAGTQAISKDANEKASEVGEKEPTSGMDMLRRIGQCRKKVMGLYRLLGNKADVIKGFAKRCNEQWEVAPKSEIGLYLGDIQDHILTMTSNLGHYETLLSRAHSNYLAQVNIRMSDRAEQNADILGKLTVLGTIVLPLNVICGMFGMNVKVCTTT